MRIIYADILIVINLAVDYLVLFGTARLAGTQFLRLRALVAAAIGAGYSLCVLFPLPQWVLWLSRLAVSVAMVLICFGKRKVCELIRLLAIFYLCGFVFSGFMLLVSLVAQPNAFLLKNGVVYFELSAIEIVLAACVAFVLTEVLRRLFRHGEADGVCIATVYYGDKTAVLKGFTDTGNSLTEPLSSAPVAVCRLDSVIEILPPNLIAVLKAGDLSTEYRVCLVPCTSIGGTVLISAIRPQRLEIEHGGTVFEAEDVMLGFSEFAPENTLLIGKNIILKEANKSFTEVR